MNVHWHLMKLYFDIFMAIWVGRFAKERQQTQTGTLSFPQLVPKG